MKIYNLKFALLIFALAMFVVGCATKQMALDADGFAQRGEWEAAAMKYEELLSEEPDNIGYRTKLTRAKNMAARDRYVKGLELRDSGELKAAFVEFKSAYTLDPTYKRAETDMRKVLRMIESNAEYERGLKFLKQQKRKAALSSFKKALALYSKNEKAAKEVARMVKDKPLVLGGFELNLKSRDPITLKLNNESIKKIFNILTKLSGINFVFDSDVRDKRTSLTIIDATFQQVLELILDTNKLSKKIVSENTIIVYPSTPQKSQQYEDLLIKVFFLENIDAKKAVNMLRSMTKIKDIYVHAERNAIVVRATPDSIAIAEKLLAATDLADAEVMLAVDIMEVSRDNTLNYGVNWPDSASAAIPTTTVSGGVDYITGLELSNLTGGDMLINIPPVVLNLAKEKLNVELLANPRIRVKNNEKASIHIGEKIPIITATISATSALATESVSYQDVGLKLIVEPTIRPNDEIDLKFKLEVSSLGTQTITANNSVVYQIGTRNAETTLRLYDGETQVIGGLITDEERTTTVSVPILGDIPILGVLFSSKNTEDGKTDIMLSITPHIVRSVELPDAELAEIWSGSLMNPSLDSSRDSVDMYQEEAPVLERAMEHFEGFEDANVLPPPPPPPPMPGGGLPKAP